MSEPAPELPVDLESETPARREARLAWERARLDEAFDDIAHGRVISGQAALDWLHAELEAAERRAASEPE